VKDPENRICEMRGQTRSCIGTIRKRPYPRLANCPGLETEGEKEKKKESATEKLGRKGRRSSTSKRSMTTGKFPEEDRHKRPIAKKST